MGLFMRTGLALCIILGQVNADDYRLKVILSEQLKIAMVLLGIFYVSN